MKRKMFVKRIDLKSLKNNLHFEFIGSILGILEKHGGWISHIVELLSHLSVWRANEEEAIDQIRKSEISAAIHEEDRLRDNAFYGMRDIIRGMRRHSNASKKEAAKRLDIVFKAFKNAPKLELPAESAAIHNLLLELGKRRPEVDLLGLDDWMEELQRSNGNIRSLMSQRTSETATRPSFRMADVRKEVNNTYDTILSKLESLADLEGEDSYANLFKEMNACVDEYLRIIAHGGGNDDKGSATPPA